MVNLSTEVAGIKFRNPILPAPGPLTRDGDALVEVANNGAGGLISKTVSIEPAETPKPNLAKIGNSLVYADFGSEISAKDWVNEEYPKAKSADLPLIASVGYTPDEVEKLAPMVDEAGADALEITNGNIVKDESVIIDSIKAAKDQTDIPVLVKLSPQLLEIDEVAKSAEDAGADGIVAISPVGPSLVIDVNTERPLMGSAHGYGWLSGPSVKPIAVRCVADIAQAVDIPVIGSGGINDERDAAEFLMAGASAVQVGTASITRGKKIFGLIADKLKKFMDVRGYDSIEDIRGVALRNLPEEPLRTTAKQPSFLSSKCTGCGLCEKHCPYGAVTIVSGKARIDSTSCTGCGLCVSVCPPNALRY